MYMVCVYVGRDDYGWLSTFVSEKRLVVKNKVKVWPSYKYYCFLYQNREGVVTKIDRQ